MVVMKIETCFLALSRSYIGLGKWMSLLVIHSFNPLQERNVKFQQKNPASACYHFYYNFLISCLLCDQKYIWQAQ